MEIISGKDSVESTVGKELIEMKKEWHVEGMSCQHCAARVEEALNALEQVKSASVNLKKKCVKIKLLEDVSDEELRKAIEDAGYQVVL